MFNELYKDIPPDQILPAQYLNLDLNPDMLSGELRLLLAVLLDGFSVFMGAQRVHRKEYEATVRWLLSDDDDSFLSFRTLCMTFNFNPDCVREKLVAIHDRRMKRHGRRAFIAGYRSAREMKAIREARQAARKAAAASAHATHDTHATQKERRKAA